MYLDIIFRKKIFVSCVCNWIYNQIYSNIVSVFIGYIYLGYSQIQVLSKFLAKTYLFEINNARIKKTITGSLIVVFFTNNKTYNNNAYNILII